MIGIAGRRGGRAPYDGPAASNLIGLVAYRGSTMTDEEAARHKTKMIRRKALQDAAVAARPILSKGLLMVYTGPGKGKSTAAFGLAIRALGRGHRVGVVQFIKGTWATGERAAFERFSDLMTWRTMGEGFTWETQDHQRDVAAARAGWAAALELMADPEIRLVILDELNIALRYDHLPLAEVVAALRGRRSDLHVVVTGRSAKPELLEAADLVTEMTQVKHHFDAGVRAQEGIEF
jgi:cob(I)alamin adenosyltransferase